MFGIKLDLYHLMACSLWPFQDRFLWFESHGVSRGSREVA